MLRFRFTGTQGGLQRGEFGLNLGSLLLNLAQSLLRGLFVFLHFLSCVFGRAQLLACGCGGRLQGLFLGLEFGVGLGQLLHGLLQIGQGLLGTLHGGNQGIFLIRQAIDFALKPIDNVALRNILRGRWKGLRWGLGVDRKRQSGNKRKKKMNAHDGP